jgi:hypothetical protein
VATPAVRIVGPPAAAAAVAALRASPACARQADQHRQHGDRPHREVAAGQRQRSERERRRGERQRQRQQPQARAEHERQRRRHHQERRAEQHEDRVLHGVREPLADHRNAGDEVLGAALGAELRLLGGGLEQVDRVAARGVAQVRLQPDRDHRRVGRGEQVGEARLRHARVAGAAVEDERGDEVGVVDARLAGDPVAQRQLKHVLRELRGDGLGGGAREALLLRRRVAAPLGQLASRLGRAGGLLLRGGLALAQLVEDPVDRGVDERRRPEHDLRRLGLGDLAAYGRQAAEPLLVVRDVAGQAALQPQEAAEVVGQHGLRQLAAHQHHHRVVAEVLLEALGRLEAVRVAVDERVGRGARLKPQRERGAAQRQQRSHGQHRQRAARDRRNDARERVPPH